MPFSTTLSMKKQTFPPCKKNPNAVKDRGWGSTVSLNAVKDSLVFLKASLISKLPNHIYSLPD